MKISVFGVGYVGLVTGVCFAEMGHHVVCADVDPEKVARLKSGLSPIYEPGLDQLLSNNLRAGRLEFTTASIQAINAADILFIAVGTPPDEDGSADLSFVLDVAANIGNHMDNNKLVVIKSTVPVGTHRLVRAKIEQVLAARGSNLSVEVCSNPEFLREGTAIEDCLKPHRVIVGLESDNAARLMQRLYEPFLKDGVLMQVMDPFSSEMTKYASNAMLATKISFMNELSRLCERVGADIEQVRRGMGSDPRIGPQFIAPGIGYGGSCFPKDVQALVRFGEINGVSLGILKAVEDANKMQREHFIANIRSHFGGDLQGRKFAVWGLAFKPGTDDIREAPALTVIRRLLRSGAQVYAFDPVAAENTRWYFKNHPQLHFVQDAYDAVKEADALLIMTEWLPFRDPDFARLKTSMKEPTIFDGRNLYAPQMMSELGFNYTTMGRPKLEALRNADETVIGRHENIELNS